eukprot:351520-Chlamydomonas_euryale.AAC.1
MPQSAVPDAMRSCVRGSDANSRSVPSSKRTVTDSEDDVGTCAKGSGFGWYGVCSVWMRSGVNQSGFGLVSLVCFGCFGWDGEERACGWTDVPRQAVVRR